MSDFDLQTLYNFRPSQYLCENCLALLMDRPWPSRADDNPQCPVCRVEYIPTERYNRYSVDEYLALNGYHLKFEGLLDHCKRLAHAVTADFYGKPNPPLRQALAALGHARHFVHFVSYGISELFVGALKIVAQRIPVRGIVANVDGERMLDEITEFKNEAPIGNFDIIPFLRGESWEEFPHQKLLVVDGLLAFKGSANLTVSGWRKAARGLDHVEVVTSVNEVIDLHNTLFSPVWCSRKGNRKTINMDVPF